jgi:hypothetical protein
VKPNILNPAWKYVPAASTDIRKTIQRELKRLEALKQHQSNVAPLKRAKS